MRRLGLCFRRHQHQTPVIKAECRLQASASETHVPSPGHIPLCYHGAGPGLANLRLEERKPCPATPQTVSSASRPQTHPPTQKLPSACVLSPPGTHGPRPPGVHTHTHTHSHTFLRVPAWLLPLAFPWASSGGHVLQLNVNIQHLPVNQPRP